MKKKEATLDYLNLQVKDSFNFKNGQQSNSLKELLDAIKTVDNETFKHHLNEEKNDFSAWIRHSIGNQLLANKIAQANTKEEVISAIDGITHKKEGKHMSDDQNKESSEINNLIDELEQETKDLSQTSKELEKAAVQDIPESSKEPTLGGTPDLIDEESEKKQKKGVFKKMFSKKEQDREEIVPADLELKEQPPILTETPPPESGEDLETIDMSTEQKESKKINDTVSKKVKDKPTKKEAKTDKEEEIPDIPDIPSGKISEQTVEPLTDEKPDENEPKLDDVDDIPFPTDFVTNDSDEMEDAEPLSLHEEVAAEAKKEPEKKGVFKKIFGKKKKEDTVQETPVQPQEDIPMDIPTPEEIFSQEETPAVEPPISDELDIPLPEEHEKESDEIILEKEPQELAELPELPSIDEETKEDSSTDTLSKSPKISVEEAEKEIAEMDAKEATHEATSAAKELELDIEEVESELSQPAAKEVVIKPAAKKKVDVSKKKTAPKKKAAAKTEIEEKSTSNPASTQVPASKEPMSKEIKDLLSIEKRKIDLDVKKFEEIQDLRIRDAIQKKQDEFAKAFDIIEKKFKELEKFERSLMKKEEELMKKDTASGKSSDQLSKLKRKHDLDIRERIKNLRELERDFSKKSKSLDQKLTEMKTLELELEYKKKFIDEKEKDIVLREEKITGWEKEAEDNLKKTKDLAKREATLESKTATLAEKDKKLKGLDKELKQKEADLKKMDSELIQREKDVAVADKAIEMAMNKFAREREALEDDEFHEYLSKKLSEISDHGEIMQKTQEITESTPIETPIATSSGPPVPSTAPISGDINSLIEQCKSAIDSKNFEEAKRIYNQLRLDFSNNDSIPNKELIHASIRALYDDINLALLNN